MDVMRMFSSAPEFQRIPFDNTLNLVDYSHAAHCCIYSPQPFHIFKNYESKAYIQMQMRFDGHLGFPGGMVEEGTGIVQGLNRELWEEVNLNSKFFVKDKDYLFSHKHVPSKLCLHFYAKEVSVDDFLLIEKDALNASDYGHENLGLIRVPLFTMDDGWKGFPAFLTNTFIGNAKDQLLNFLLHFNLMSLDDIKESQGSSGVLEGVN